MGELLTPAEVAQRLKVTARQVRNYVNDGTLEHVRISPRVIRIPASSLEKLLEARLNADT